MFQELCIQHIHKGKRRYLALTGPSYRLGKALDNDVVLLDADCPSHLGVIQKMEGRYVWQQKDQTVDLITPVMTHGFRLQVRNAKPWISTLIFSSLLLVSMVFFQWMYGVESADSSSRLPARGTYGHLNESSSEIIDRISFDFDGAAEKHLTLHYTSGNLSKPNDLQIEINGNFLSFAPASPGKWNVEIQKFIPKSLLNPEKNNVTFVFLGSKKQTWGIRDIYIESSNELPSQLDGKDFLLTAKKFLKERSVKPGNLVRAQQVLDQAAQFYQAKNLERPASLSEMIARVQKEKQRMILDHAELIRKYKRENQGKKAKIIFEKLMDELIDPMDSDRLVAEREFQ